MRSTAAIGLAALLFCFWTHSVAQAQPAQCKAGPAAIGVSRTVEIDASTGPRFGRSQYRDFDFLQDGEVVLTFDDGPSRRHTPAILDALDAHCTKATFFSVGRMAVADPEMLQETAMRGHTIGTHTWSHKNLRSLSLAQARAEVELGLSAVQAALGGPVAPFFRFPYLSDPQPVQAMLQQRGIATFSIDADSYDFRTSSPQMVQENILNQLAQRKKGILLFHDIQPSTARALKGLLDELKARGYRVVHIVPKAPATTLADFDEMAEQVLRKKQVAASEHPLARHPASAPLAHSSGASRPRPSHSAPRQNHTRQRYRDDRSWIERVFQN
jgi:peptidoglycan/xylan/chitin deacetylase (PgdA/CDA1 family)